MSIERQLVLLMFPSLTHKDPYVRESDQQNSLS